MEKIFLYDTTLRDGAQQEGISFSLNDKLKITDELDKLGIDFIEGGWPGSNPKDIDYFEKVKKLKLGRIRVTAFGSTRKKDTRPENDDNLLALLKAGTRDICLFGKAWDMHVRYAIKTTPEENLKMIEDSVGYLISKGKNIIYDAEHFFDGYKNNPDYALKTIIAAAGAGADWIVLCDTNGGSLPQEIKDITVEVIKSLGNKKVGIHAHNDNDCGVANSLMAVEAGARQVQGTINGYGERCGNANLCSVIPNLSLKMEYETISPEQIKLITEVSHLIAETANLTPNAHQPFVGQSAFAHKGGVHVSAVEKKQDTYEHINPALVGNIRKIVVSELAGKSTVIMKAQELGLDLSTETTKVQDILNKVKELEHGGYYFESADGSFEVLIRKIAGKYKPIFKLESFRVLMEKRENGEVDTEATVKIVVKGKRMVATGEGNGPVNALDSALRQALEQAYPYLKEIFLTDYKVRVLDEKKGTAAKVRVLIETSNGEQTWGSVGVSENIIEASWQALVDSLDHGSYLSQKKKKK